MTKNEVPENADDKEQSKRFLEAARKSEAEDKKAFEKAIEFIAKNKENNE